MHSYFKAVCLLLTVTLASSSLQAQQAILFLEPNVSFAYDTAKMKASKSTDSKGMRSVRFRIKKEQIQIDCDAQPLPKSTPTGLDKPATIPDIKTLLEKRVETVSKDEVETYKKKIVDKDKAVKKVGEFYCMGFATKSKDSRSTQIYGYAISENHYVYVRLFSLDAKSLDDHYKILESLFSSFKSYSKEFMAEHDRQNKAKYAIVVKPADLVMAPQFKDRAGDFLAVLTTKETLVDKVKEAWVSQQGGYTEVFSPNEKGEVYIALKANKTGVHETEGAFSFISSIGKQYLIPFKLKFEKK